MEHSMKSYVTEAIGTFFLVFTIGLCVNQGVAMAPLAIGFALAVMIYAGGPISGGHYNPSVTVAAWLRGALPAKEVIPYWLSQFAGAILAALLIHKFTGHPLHVAPAASASMLKALGGEIVFSFALSYVVLHVATVHATAGNSYFGLAIGSTVMVGAFAMGGISGGAFNPAVGLGPAIYEMVAGSSPSPLAWIYAVGPILGATAAAFAFKFQRPGE
jgi:aquaporin Z